MEDQVLIVLVTFKNHLTNIIAYLIDEYVKAYEYTCTFAVIWPD